MNRMAATPIVTATAPATDWRSVGAAVALHVAAVLSVLQFSQTTETPPAAQLIMASLMQASPTAAEPVTPAAPPRALPAPSVPAVTPARAPERSTSTMTPATAAEPVRAVAPPVLSTAHAAATETSAPAPTKPAPATAVSEPRHDKPDTSKSVDSPVAARTEPAPDKAVPATSAAPAAASAPSPARENELNSYLAALMRRLARFKVYPAALKKDKVEGRVVLGFTIAANGQLIASSVQKSSGHPALDQAALDMLSRASPLPAVPASMQRTELSLSIPVEYSLIKDP